ncbi:MAG: hypothetical protein HXO52_05000 [Prevotella sp.]|nr:hypothetical protein [Prevotella sp.]
MRKLYSIMLLAVMLLLSVNTFAQGEDNKETAIKVNVDDVSRVAVRVNYGQPLDLQNGENTVKVPQYGSIQIEAKTGCFLLGVTRSKLGEDPVDQPISYHKSCSIYVANLDAGISVDVESGTFEEYRDVSFTLKVDDASKVRASLAETQTSLSLQNGDNSIKFVDQLENTLMIGSASYGGAPIYKVTQDGKDIPSNDGEYRVTLTPNTVVSVQANYPDVDCPVKFNFSDEAIKGVLSKVMVDGQEVNNYLASNFTVKAGKKISLNFNTNDYALDELKVNGKKITIYGISYDYLVADETTIDVKAHKYAMLHAKVSVDTPANVTFYHGQSYQNKVVSLVAGENNIEFGERNKYFELKPVSGCKINSVKIDGVLQSASYDGSYQLNLTDGANVEIKTSKIVRDKKATIVIDDLSASPYGFNFERADHSTITMNTGDNTLMFTSDDNPFRFSAYGADANTMVVKLNGQKVASIYPNSTSYEVTLQDGDRLEIKIKGDPTGIEAVRQSANGKNEVYRLDGTRVNETKLPRGIYIINGKKVIIK